MGKLIKEYKYLFLVMFIGGFAFASGVPQKWATDTLQFGNGASSDSKQIIVDTGDGAGNPAITIDMTNKDFDLNKALNIVSTQMTLGSGAAADQEFIFDIGLGAANPRFIWDQSELALSFANDGVNFKKIGSGAGGGGGVNVLAENNFDFESGTPPSDWTASGGTFVAETAAPLFGKQSGSWDASALSQTLDSVLGPITTGFLGNSCQAEVDYIYAAGAKGDYKLVVRQYDDSGASELSVAEVDLEVTATKKKAQVFFDCPDDVADDLRIRIEAGVADPGVVVIDDAFIGTGRNSFQLSQTELAFSGYFASTGSCSQSITNTVFADFPTVAACPAITVESSTQSVDLTDNDRADRITFTSLPKGNYKIKMSGNVTSSDPSAILYIRLTDGTTTGAECHVRQNSVSGFETKRMVCEMAVQYTTSGSRTIKLQGAANTGSIDLRTDIGSTLWEVVKYPESSAEAITLSTVGRYWDVNIGGANPSLLIANVSSYTPIGDASLDMVVNSGSAPAEIPCDAGNPPTGLTCSAGVEQIGIAIDVLEAGRYQVCLEASSSARLNAIGSSIQTAFQWVETPTNAETILQEGKSRILVGFDFTAGASAIDETTIKPMHICGMFTFGSVGKKVLKLKYEQAIVGAPISHVIVGDRAAAAGQRDMHITVEKMDEQKPTPVFLDLQNQFAEKVGSGDNGIVTYAAVISDTAVCALFSTLGGNWISSITDNGIGDCTVNFAGGFFDGVTQPLCTFTTTTAGGSIVSGSASTYRVQAIDAAGAQSNFAGAHLICMGKK